MPCAPHLSFFLPDCHIPQWFETTSTPNREQQIDNRNFSQQIAKLWGILILNGEISVGYWIFEYTRRNMSDRYSKVRTTIGGLWLAFSPVGITMITLADRDPLEFEAYYRGLFSRQVHYGKMPQSYRYALKQAAAGYPPPDIEIDLSSLSEFEREVLMLLRHIAHGEVRTYSWLAREAGRPKAVRPVGNVMAKNPLPILLPCHRIVPLTGGIGNYGLGSNIKRDLLLREGVPVEEIEFFQTMGIRYIGDKTKRFYCYPTCHGSRPLPPAYRISFSSVKEAICKGFRPCPHCKPEGFSS